MSNDLLPERNGDRYLDRRVALALSIEGGLLGNSPRQVQMMKQGLPIISVDRWIATWQDHWGDRSHHDPEGGLAQGPS